MLLVVGRIGRAHGVRGEATIEIRTDNPEARFFVGAELKTDPMDKGPLTIREVKVHSGTLLLAFEGVADRTAVEKLRNVLLLAEVDPRESNTSEDDFHISQIVDCTVIDESGREWGKVVDVLQLPAQDTLVVEHEGKEVLVPFVKAYVPKVDIETKRLTIINFAGLL
ncbi:MAG: ribosome maturation factor RimM [Candidatus Nanopelagicaceae bacterium]|nr:ribosome maturation factor RimM [Candidatus Nanopelagicaceae bacterium]